MSTCRSAFQGAISQPITANRALEGAPTRLQHWYHFGDLHRANMNRAFDEFEAN